jgi:hypothetical protein
VVVMNDAMHIALKAYSPLSVDTGFVKSGGEWDRMVRWTKSGWVREIA